MTEHTPDGGMTAVKSIDYNGLTPSWQGGSTIGGMVVPPPSEPSLSITLTSPDTLADFASLVALAERMGFAPDCTVTVWKGLITITSTVPVKAKQTRTRKPKA